LLPYHGEGFFAGSLAEALGCVIRGYKGFYHTEYTNYVRTDGAKKGGRLAILGGAGPMGIGAVELALGYGEIKQVVVTDLNQQRLDFAAKSCSCARASEKGLQLHYLNTSGLEDPADALLALSDGGFDDVFVMVPVPALFTLAERICREDGCINFFAGPAVHDLPGSLNLYRVHYDGIHVVGTAGSIPQDMLDVLHLTEEGHIRPGALVSHILGLNAAADTLLAMEKPDGAKKICYNELDLPLTAIADFAELGKTDPMFAQLHTLVQRHGGLWNAEAEAYLLENCPKL
jgi:threonine dehydrogenase-like Zn-dependent dehydrogenase